MIITLEEVKQYLRLELDYTEEDNFLNLLINAAEKHLLNATEIQFDNTNELAKLYCLVLIADWYENREFIGRISEKIRFTIVSILTQLKYCYIPEESSDV
ncbi:head-tail connector protein [Caminicella sporogenes]|uniref:head-tail connector protein n=1 Tax=Caminicella sporogenes TaxID=166485 RepID=UPI0025425F0F|nr:head-tail connector protein [Caminicella sporogenes]WIF95127.1 head-tail connector protein [Caminicella sporogenes]